jgi:hypothetical protein
VTTIDLFLRRILQEKKEGLAVKESALVPVLEYCASML